MEAISPITMRRQLGAPTFTHGNSLPAPADIVDHPSATQADIDRRLTRLGRESPRPEASPD